MRILLIRSLFVLMGLSGLAIAGLYAVGMSPTSLGANIAVGTGMGAKLACSGRFLSGFDDARIRQDLASYSAAADWFSVDIDDQAQRARVSLMGFAGTSATYRDGIGCTLDLGESDVLTQLMAPDAPMVDDALGWPAGPAEPVLNETLARMLAASMAQDQAEGLETRALVLVQHGQLLAEAYAPGVTPKTRLMGWSMGKSLTALMLGWLEQRGQLTVDERRLFDEWSSDERATIKIQNLLQMTSGLDFSEVYVPGSDATRMLFMEPSAASVPLQSPLKYAPGSHFSYSSGTTNLLSLLFTQRVGGPQQAINHLYQDILWPLGMRDTTLEPDASGVFVGSSNIYATARDWARLGEAFLHQGELNGVRIARKSYMDELVQPNASSNDRAYGYQVWLNRGEEALYWPDLPDDVYGFSGNRGQSVMIFPTQQAVMVRLGWSAKNYPANDRFAEWLRALASQGD